MHFTGNGHAIQRAATAIMVSAPQCQRFAYTLTKKTSTKAVGRANGRRRRRQAHHAPTAARNAIDRMGEPKNATEMSRGRMATPQISFATNRAVKSRSAGREHHRLGGSERTVVTLISSGGHSPENEVDLPVFPSSFCKQIPV